MTAEEYTPYPDSNWEEISRLYQLALKEHLAAGKSTTPVVGHCQLCGYIADLFSGDKAGRWLCQSCLTLVQEVPVDTPTEATEEEAKP